MKRIALLTVLLLVLGLASGFAADSPVAVTGSLGFGIGVPDFAAGNPIYPQFNAYESSSATATLKASLANDAITAGVDINLMALPTVTRTDAAFQQLYPAQDPLLGGAFVNNWAAPYKEWLKLSGYVTFWNNNYGDVDVIDGATTIWKTGDLAAAYATLTAQDKGGLLDATSAESAIVIYAFANADFAKTPVLTALTTESGNFFTKVDAAVENALAYIIGKTSAAVQADIAASAGALLSDKFVAYLANGSTGLTYTQIAAFAADDRAYLKQAADLYVAWQNAVGAVGIAQAASLAVKGNFLSGANVTFHKVAGLLDISYLFGGQHAAAGSINADYSGHSSTAVSSYSGLSVALASGVVPGVTGGLSFYASAPSAEVTDVWYNILDVPATITEPAYGLGVNAGYSMAIMEGTTVGADVMFAMYDLLATRSWAFSVKPAFSGFGATVGGEFAYGLDGVMIASVNASYAIMGITVSPFFKYAAKGTAYVPAYVATVTTIDQSIMNGGGYDVGANLSADISKLVAAVPVTVTAGLTYGAATLEWNAGLSATMMGFTLAANANSAPLLTTGNLDYSVSLSYAYDKATLKAAYTSAWSAALGYQVNGLGLTCALSF
jgi:hypothetical protein